MAEKTDKYEGMGGSYIVKNGERVLVERTQDHPEGNCPRAADGTPLDAGVPRKAEAAAAPAKPAQKSAE
jgi:hypothetical protein